MEKIIVEEETYFKKNIIKAMKGAFISIAITVILLFILSIIMAYTDISEEIIPISIIVITGISILMRKFYKHDKNQKKWNDSWNNKCNVIYYCYLYLI